MLKRILAVAALSASFAGAALAQAEKDPNQCVRSAHELAQAAEDKQLANDKLDKIEDLLNKMEDLCDANQLTEAMALAKDIEAAINAQ